jgi:hypothetical protein
VRSLAQLGDSFRNTTATYALAALPLVTPVPIQDVQLFDYAVAHKSVNVSYGLQANNDDTYIIGNDPYNSDQQRSRDQYEINDTDWNEVSFEQVDGTSKCKLALHNDWIAHHNYAVDGIVNMNLPEQGISGPFKITSIKHIIPQKKPVDEDPSDDYEYRPVTGLFTHQSNDVWKISFDNGETLGVTNNHPIFSVSKGDWQHAGHLEIGEEVLAKGGNTKIVSKEKDLNIQPVYNLEVKDLHNFLVGNVGVVVHNNCLDEAAEAGVKTKLAKEAAGDVVDEVFDEVGAEAAEQAIKKGRKLTWPELLALFKRGNNFNKEAWTSNPKWCQYDEVHLINGKRLDGYNKDLGEIVSRKATTFDEIELSTFEKYLKEIDDKYVDQEIRSNKYPNIDKEIIQGQKIIEVPNINQNSAKLAEFQRNGRS